MTSWLREGPRTTLGRYGFAVLTIVVATVFRYLLDPVLRGSGFSIYFAAVVIVGWVSGLGPCLLAQFLGFMISAVFFSAESQPEPDPVLSLLAGLAAYVFVGVAVSFLSNSMRAAQKNAIAEADHAHSQRDQLQTTLACIGEGVIVTDENGRLTMINRVAADLTGWAADQAIGRQLSEVFRLQGDDPGAYVASAVARALRDRRVVAQDSPVTLTSRDGTERPVAYTAAPIFHGSDGTNGVVLVFHDETERQRTEQTLREADRRKDQFLALLAHELRNPLAPIGNAIEILGIRDLPAELHAESRDMMQRQFDHLVRLVDDLLDVSRIARGKIELRIQEVDLRAVAQRAVEAARPVIENFGHTLSVEVPEEAILIAADPVRLAQLVTNLLNNAAKYSDCGGKIELSVASDGREITLSVRDNGIGIAPEMLPHIFEMFMQVDQSTTRAQSGLGIGLTLVSSIAQMHGGHAEARSDGLGQGSTFLVRLPVRAWSPLETASPAPAAEPVLPLRRNVLVVDDNIDAAESLARLLRSRNHDVVTAHSGRAALEVIDGRRPDVIILDLGMPEMDGFEVARQVRASHADEIQIVALTGWGSAADRLRTSEAGFDHHFVKPVRPEDLDQILNGG